MSHTGFLKQTWRNASRFSGIASNRIAAAWTLLESQDMGNVFARVVEAYDRRIDVASRALQESNSAKDMLALAAGRKQAGNGEGPSETCAIRK